MSYKIIKPEGIELIEYLNNGYAICNRCGAVMRQTEDPKTGCGIYICPRLPTRYSLFSRQISAE